MTKTTSPEEIGNIRLLLLVVIAGLLLTLHYYHPPQRGLWTQIFFDSLHVPVFGLIAVCLYAGIPKRYSCLKRAILALILTCSLGVLSELAQVFTSRDASLHDLMADASGAASFLLCRLAISHSPLLSLKRRGMYILLAAFILGLSLLSLGKVSAAYLERNSIVPNLINIGSPLSGHFVRKQNIELETIRLSEDQVSMAMTFSARPWPGVAFHDLWPDWRTYSTLVLELSVGETIALELNVRVHDRDHNDAYTDRYNKTFILTPGAHQLEIPLDSVRMAPRDRQMDLSRIEEIIIFGRASDAGRSLLIHQIRLE